MRAIGNTDTFLESMDALINKGWYLDLFKPVTLFPGFRRFFYSEWKENNELLGRLFRKDKSKGGAGILPVLLTVTALEAAGCDLQILENPDLSKLWIHYKDYFGRVANDPEVQRASHSLILRIEELRIQTESVYLTLYEKRAKLAQQYGVPLSPEAV